MEVDIQKARVIHFINQFFADVGGDDKADTPVGSSKELLDPWHELKRQQGWRAIVGGID